MICRHCGKPIHRDAERGWVHAASLRVRCQNNEADAEPREGHST